MYALHHIKLRDWVVWSRNACTGSNADSIAKSAQIGVEKLKVMCTLEQALEGLTYLLHGAESFLRS